MKRVFVVGAARSGTTLLNKLLVMSGSFALYRAETLLLSVVQQRYGKIGKNKNRFINDWFKSRQFLRSGLSEDKFIDIYESSKDYVELLIGFMDAVATSQGVACWSDSTPAHINSIEELLGRYPDVYIINMIRDGRDVAVSQERLGWVASPPGLSSRCSRLICAISSWRRSVEIAEQACLRHPGRILNIKYEDLVVSPESTLNKVSTFLDVDISFSLEEALKDKDSMLGANTPFSSTMKGISKEGLGRYQYLLSKDEAAILTRTVSPILNRYGYSAEEAVPSISRLSMLRERLANTYTKLYLTGKRFAVEHGLGRYASSTLEFD